MISNEIGNKYDKLLILSEVESKVYGHRQYRCLCDCGKEHIVTRNNILRGISKQCKSCSQSQKTATNTTVNVKGNRLTYNSWRSMLLRCNEIDRYKHVKICDEWREPITGFLKFLEEMGPRPAKEYTLDRIDSKGHYHKGNCRWATAGIQNHNKGKKCTAKTSSFIGVSLGKTMWTMQFMYSGMRFHESFYNEADAAVYYDNLSEIYYGDRPNKTQYSFILPDEKVVGSVNLTRSGTYRVRLTVPSGERKNIGHFQNQLLANFVLSNEITKYYY